MAGKPRKLATSVVPKVWGSRNLSPWYPEPHEQIGEVWFRDNLSVSGLPPAELPLLVKFIFTSDRLSIQVHPNDAYAAVHENGSLGKTEMWHILRADPGAQIAVGFRESITPERLREASLSGEIVNLVNWIDVKAGDTFFTPAGTVHAIGAGLALCEIQQHSDITYRLYDYGRPRELHLEKGIAVTDMRASTPAPVGLPVECPYFRTDALSFGAPATYTPRANRFEVLIVLAGAGAITDEPYRAGDAWLLSGGCGEFQIEPACATAMLRTFVP